VDKLLLENEINVAFADGGSGKSLLALALAVAVNTGKPLPAGLTPKRTGAVLYLDWESCKEEHDERLAGILGGLGIAGPVPIFYRHMVGAVADESRSWGGVARLGTVWWYSTALAGPGAEPEGAVPHSGPWGAAPSRSDQPGPGTRQQAPCGQKDATLRIVHVMNVPRNVWEIRRTTEEERDTLTIGLFHRKVNRGRLLPAFGLRFAFGEAATRIQAVDVAETSACATGRRGYRDPRRPAARARTIAQVAEAGRQEDTIQKAMYRLEGRGIVVRVGDTSLRRDTRSVGLEART
jgi:hypothetical protein